MDSNQKGSHTLTLKATSVQDPSKSDSYTFTLNVSVPTVEIEWGDSTDLPTYYNIASETTATLSALVVGTYAPDQSVQWEIINDTSNGMVSLDANTLKFSWNQLTTIGNYSFDVKATSTKYGSSATKHFTFTVDNALPTKLLDIDENGVLKGFVSDFNKDDYENKGYDTIKIPTNVTGIAAKAFDFGALPSEKKTTYIKNIDLSDCRNLTYIGSHCFRWFNSIENVNFSGCSNLLHLYAFLFEETKITRLDLSQTGLIELNNETGKSSENMLHKMQSLQTLIFPGTLKTISANFITTIGTDESLNQIIWNDLTSLPTITNAWFNRVAESGTVQVTGNSSITSAQLLAHLKAAGLPSTWTTPA